jgi:hypothetical protein
LASPRVKRGDVFINIRFGRPGEWLYLALIAGIVGVGLNPRCVVQVPYSRERLRRIFNLIRSCAYSIHDLSCVQLGGAGKFRVPRFNMPFELGLAVALSLRQKHEWAVFECVPYRLTRSLSDLNGYDQYTHQGAPDGVLEKVADLFHDLPSPPKRDPEELLEVYRVVRRFRRAKLPADVFTARSFAKLVVAAREASIPNRSSV